MEKERQLAFDRVWVVFDKDDFNDFNEAIKLAANYSFKCAWTNEAFELWYLLHFQYLDTGINRHDYIVKLQNEIRKHPGYEDYIYSKDDPSIYFILKKIGNEDWAKKRANQLRSMFMGDTDYKKHNPCTMVDLLVSELENVFPKRVFPAYS